MTVGPAPRARSSSPFDGPVNDPEARSAHWVQPELVAGGWVRLRAPGFSWERPLVVYTRDGEPQAPPLARLLAALHHAAAEASSLLP